MTTTTVGAEPTLLSYSRAILDRADSLKTRYWRLEAVAALASIASACAPYAAAAAAASGLAVALKAAAKHASGASRGAFRLGERMRRYNMEQNVLGWQTPPRERADFALANRDVAVAKLAAALAPAEPAYFQVTGDPGPRRLFANLVESLFWSERLMGIVAKARFNNFLLSALAPIISVLVLAVTQPGDVVYTALKAVAACVAFMVSVDVFGEWKAFLRGEKEIANLFAAAMAEMNRPALRPTEGQRLFLEYNCALAELPQIPARAYRSNKDALNAAWEAFWPPVGAQLDKVAPADGEPTEQPRA